MDRAELVAKMRIASSCVAFGQQALVIQEPPRRCIWWQMRARGIWRDCKLMA